MKYSTKYNWIDKDAIHRDVEWISETMGPEYLGMNMMSGTLSHLLSIKFQNEAIVLWAWLYSVYCETEDLWFCTTYETLAKERDNSVSAIQKYLKCLSNEGYLTIEDRSANGIKIMAVIPDAVWAGIVVRTKAKAMGTLQNHRTNGLSKKYFVSPFEGNSVH